MRRLAVRGSDLSLFSRGLPALTVLAALALTACGGGDNAATATTTQQQAGDTNTPVVPTQPLLVTGLDQACSGVQCSAATSATFSGAGTGIWGHTNAGGTSEDVQFSISGLLGTSISLLLTNVKDTLALMPAGLSASMLDATTVTRLSPQALTADAEAEARRREIAEFNRTGWAEKVAAAQPLRQTLGVPAPHAVAVPGVGSTKSWYHTGSTRPATLRKQMTATDGTLVNVWVEDSQYNVVNGIDSTIVDDLGAAFAGTGKIYDLLTGIGGAVWGANTHPDTVLPAGQPIDIVILNFDGNGAPGGTVGYFWGLHNLLKTADSRSNESISLYLDSETLALGGATGMKAMKMTMAHEGTHMQNFYRRAVKMGTAYAYDDWLEEMTAMQMEDFLSYSIDPTYNAIRDVRFPDFYRYSGFNCPLLTFTGGGTCESYSVSGSFGGFLDRQLGLPFYKDLLTRQVVGSKTVLDQAIQAAQPGLSFNLALTRWAATNGSGMPADKAPTGYGYPRWTDGTFELPEIDPASTANAALRKLPASVPTFLQGLGTLPLKRTATNGVYSDKVRLPAGVTLSVVAY
jgi:hypothetical protein